MNAGHISLASASGIRKVFLAVLILHVVSRLAPAGETYAIDPEQSRIAFSVRHLLGTARGEFHKFRGTIEVDPARPERSSVNVTIFVESIDTKIRKRDDHLLSADFFDAKKFPEITFRSRRIRQTGAAEGEIVGDLTMHGVTRPVTLQVKLATPIPDGAAPARTRWEVTTPPLRRKDFGLLFGSTTEAISGIGQEVVPAMEIEASRRR